ncbi:MAG TPA: DNA polymerase III subunit delta' [Clostridiaceae bacterium]
MSKEKFQEIERKDNLYTGDIIGHEVIRNSIKGSILQNRISHAHIIFGEEGLGKSLVAREFALRILGRDKDRDYVDLATWRVKDNKLSIGADEIRSIIEEVNKKPYEGDKKVIIVHEADKMTHSAQNIFLKTIEEPPKGVYIILLCENTETILETVKSRCQTHLLRRLTKKEMVAYIAKEYGDLSGKDKKVMISFSEGIPGRVDKFIKDADFRALRDKTLLILKYISEKNKKAGLDMESFFAKDKDNWKEILTWLVCFIRDIMVYKETGVTELLLNIDKIKEIEEIASMVSISRLNSVLDIVAEASGFLLSNVNLALVYDTMIFKMMEV